MLQVCLFNSNYSIQHNPFICTLSNCSKYCYLIQIIQFRHTVKKFQVLLFNSNNSTQHQSFDYTQVRCSKNCYVSLKLQLIISHLFPLSFKQFYSTHRRLSNATTAGQCGPRSDSNEGVLCTPQSSSITYCFLSKTGYYTTPADRALLDFTVLK